MYVVLAIIVIAISAFNIVSAITAKKKLTLVLNGVFYSLIVITLIGFNVNSTIIDNYSEDYDTYHGGFLGTVEYERTEGNYYIITDRGFMYSDKIAVPIESVDISPISKIYKPVIFCCSKGTELYENEITINSSSYYLCNTAEKIIPNFFDLLLVVLIVDVVVIVILNLILLPANIVKAQDKH